MKKFRGCLSVFGIFIFGVIFGVVVATSVIREKIQGIVEGGPDKIVEVVVNRLKKDLHLDQNQEEMLHQIAVETQIQLSTLRQQTQPQVARTLDDATQKVRGILNPDQVKKFDEIVEKARTNWRSERVPVEQPEKSGDGASGAPAEKAKE
jgi:hypothetical protein